MNGETKLRSVIVKNPCALAISGTAVVAAPISGGVILYVPQGAEFYLVEKKDLIL